MRPRTRAHADVRAEPSQAVTENDPHWYRDAVIYQVHVRAFFDSTNDGVGDFAGLTEKLDYIQALGVSAIWLQPFYPSPLRDDGYDIAHYQGVNPSYGTRRDFRTFLDAAHELQPRPHLIDRAHLHVHDAGGQADLAYDVLVEVGQVAESAR